MTVNQLRAIFIVVVAVIMIPVALVLNSFIPDTGWPAYLGAVVTTTILMSGFIIADRSGL